LAYDRAQAADAERLRRSTERYYRTLWRTDRSQVSAAFGLARRLLAGSDRAGAVRVLDEVPLASRHYGEAQLTSVLMLLDKRSIEDITEADLRDAARRVGTLAATEPRALQMRAFVLGTALDWLGSGATPATTDPLFGEPFDEHGLRAAVEETLRELARHSPRRRHRYTLVDLANAIRPPTWV
jgi:serine/threonine-protein kinase PknG